MMVYDENEQSIKEVRLSIKPKETHLISRLITVLKNLGNAVSNESLLLSRRLESGMLCFALKVWYLIVSTVRKAMSIVRQVN